MAHVLFPLPSQDFDPSEAAISWQVLSRLGHRVSFATPDGQAARCDPIMISGRGLDPWGLVPLLGHLKLVGLVLRANKDARDAYRAMTQDADYRAPLVWDRLRVGDFDALLLSGGHRARGMRQYLESPVLQELVADFFAADLPVAAICHGVLLAARSRDAAGRSVLHGRRTTSLTWSQERLASSVARVGRFWDRHYYRTYPEQAGQPAGYMSVQQEVTRALESPDHYLDVPAEHPLHRTKTRAARDRPGDDRAAWVVRDRNYVSARWPGDAHTFAETFGRVLEEARAGG